MQRRITQGFQSMFGRSTAGAEAPAASAAVPPLNDFVGFFITKVNEVQSLGCTNRQTLSSCDQYTILRETCSLTETFSLSLLFETRMTLD